MLCFRKYPVAKKFMDKREGGGVGREYHDFPLENFCLTVPQNFVEEPFCVSESLWYRKMLRMREGAGITFFRQSFFCLTVPKNSVGEPLVCH